MLYFIVFISTVVISTSGQKEFLFAPNDEKLPVTKNVVIDSGVVPVNPGPVLSGKNCEKSITTVSGLKSFKRKLKKILQVLQVLFSIFILEV
jgi:hypothetical protein